MSSIKKKSVLGIISVFDGFCLHLNTEPVGLILQYHCPRAPKMTCRSRLLGICSVGLLRPHPASAGQVVSLKIHGF